MNTPDAPDPRKVAEAALDVFVYAPLGLALEAKELLPKLTERGRNQVVLARLGARFAMQKAEAEAEKLLSRLQPPATPTPTPTPATASAAAPVTVVVDAPGSETSAPPAAPRAPKPSTKPKTTKAAKAAPRTTTGGALAIPGYDTLSASQIVPRLDALRAAELEAIRAHEVAHRGRRTILSRIAQLQG